MRLTGQELAQNKKSQPNPGLRNVVTFAVIVAIAAVFSANKSRIKLAAQRQIRHVALGCQHPSWHVGCLHITL